MNDRSAPLASETMLFGKLPCQGDFLRVRMKSAAAFAFEAWLTRAVELAAGRVPEGPVRFVVDLAADAGRDPLRLVGTFIPSGDSVGRAFPLAAFCAFSADLSDVPWAALPAFYAPFFDGAEQRLTLGRASPAALLADSIAHTKEPHPSSIPAAWDLAREALSRESTDVFAARLLGQGAQGDIAYALSTLQQACSLVESASAGLMLDAPIASETDLSVWLELVRAALGARRAMPSFVWDVAQRRALIVLGPPPDALLAVLLDREHPSQRRWPLWTTRRDAVTFAEGNLPAEVTDELSARGTLKSLRDAIERWGAGWNRA